MFGEQVIHFSDEIYDALERYIAFKVAAKGSHDRDAVGVDAGSFIIGDPIREL